MAYGDFKDLTTTMDKIFDKLDKLWFSCEIVHYGKSLNSIFQEFFASIDKIWILGGRLSTRL